MTWGWVRRKPAGESAPLGKAERDAQWIAQVRWAHDHLQHRLEIASQLALGILALQGVLVVLLVETPGTLDDIKSWFTLGALLLLVAGAVVSLVALRPRPIQSVNIKAYQAYWIAESYGEGVQIPDSIFVEESLQHDGSEGSLESTAGVLQTRQKRTLASIALTLCSLILLVVGYVIDMVS